ncbi:preprotein translocase subunit SecA (ATPase RNA helicase)-like [Rhodopseudomonas palustris]|uniref:Preprotein translocase subunit SecA (ATPase RNA helicase)-like n=1 Tax=Rhodopseudomonas palustris (strain BisB18) TaxID=316056 RepID=Q20XS1_RHOPB
MLSDAASRERAQCLRQRAAGTPLDELALPMFALVREAARRTLAEAHVAEQLIGGLALRDGCVAEMQTGEGKTLTATLVVAVEEAHRRGQPVLIGTPSIEHCDAVAAYFAAHGWSQGDGERTFTVLHARHHADEARIIAKAGGWSI